MKIYKIAYNDSPYPRSFDSTDVRRLAGIFNDFEGWARDAGEEMEKWIDNDEYDISFTEAKNRLHYYLAQLQLLD